MHHAREIWEPIAGALLMVTALLDLFLTVLYARAGAGFISDMVARTTWACFHRLAGMFGRHRDIVLSISGSVIVVTLVATWAGMLTVGSALIQHPFLGTSVRSQDQTPRDFLTALYAGGSSMSLVGASDFSAKTTVFRLVYLLNSLIGMSVMSLALTYIMQVYSALQQRNTFGLMLHQMSSRTGDAAVLVSALGPNDKFSAGYSNLGEIAGAISNIREAHDFYPVLFYFRFPEVRYAASRTALLALDAVSIIRAAIPDGDNGWIKNSASVRQLWEACMSLLVTLEHTFLPGMPAERREPGAEDRERWTRRFEQAVSKLHEAGIHTVPTSEAVNRYIEQRCCWNGHIVSLAKYMGWSMKQIDAATPD